MNNRAYTLIELIVVMMLISTMLVIAVPSLKDSMAAQPLRSEVRKLVDCITEIRSSAAREQVDHVLHIDLDNGSFQAQRAADSAVPPQDMQPPGDPVWNLPKGIRIADIRIANGELQNTGKASILFSSQGYAQPAILHLLRRDNRSVSLTISPFLNEVEVRSEQAEDPEQGRSSND